MKLVLSKTEVYFDGYCIGNIEKLPPHVKFNIQKFLDEVVELEKTAETHAECDDLKDQVECLEDENATLENRVQELLEENEALKSSAKKPLKRGKNESRTSEE